jgi:hypothetical protein
LFVQGKTINDALNISKKIKGNLIYITPISHELYMEGIGRKYRSR